MCTDGHSHGGGEEQLACVDQRCPRWVSGLAAKGRRSVVTILYAVLLVGAAAVALAQDEGEDAAMSVPIPPGLGAAIDSDGPDYSISQFVLQYVRENPSHTPVEELMSLPISLGRAADGFVAARPDVQQVTATIDQLNGLGAQTYYASAVQAIIVGLRDHLQGQHLLGMYVAPDPLQITETGQDLRRTPPGGGALTLVIATGSVTKVRTLGSGDRFSEKGPINPDDRIDHPVHDRIREQSPIKPYAQGDEEQTDLLRQDVLDRYLFHLSRHPGRRVDASIAAGDEEGSVYLDYQVTENPPLALYVQASNTGTASTGYMRYRFGVLHTQLTNHDDVFNFDFITSFEGTNAALGSYELPLVKDNRVRGRVYASWTEFDASELGIFGQNFTGTSWAIGGEVIANIWQKREHFIDAYGGMRYEDISVDNEDLLIFGDEGFVIPYIGLRYERRTDWISTQANVQLEWWLSNADSLELAALGRTDPDTDPMVLRGGIVQSIYLEPLLNRKKWEDLSTPKDSTLAHELLLSLRGQYAFGDRLIPQAEMVVGGLYSVRGYPEAIVAGDDAVIGSVEYRLHLPRVFDLEPEPPQFFGRTFRRAPQYVFGPVDWDLVPKVFFDVGKVYVNDPLPFESDYSLMSVGIGIDIIYRRNLNVRIDWGFVLDDIPALNVNDGSNRLHFVATILF